MTTDPDSLMLKGVRHDALSDGRGGCRHSHTLGGRQPPRALVELGHEGRPPRRHRSHPIVHTRSPLGHGSGGTFATPGLEFFPKISNIPGTFDPPQLLKGGPLGHHDDLVT